jgi:hypothetical protein
MSIPSNRTAREQFIAVLVFNFVVDTNAVHEGSDLVYIVRDAADLLPLRFGSYC